MQDRHGERVDLEHRMSLKGQAFYLYWDMQLTINDAGLSMIEQTK